MPEQTVSTAHVLEMTEESLILNNTLIKIFYVQKIMMPTISLKNSITILTNKLKLI
jgi:hypothetical protein